MKDKTIISLFAMGLITFLDAIALIYLHIDGTLLTMTVAAIAGIAGYQVAKTKEDKVIINEGKTINN